MFKLLRYFSITSFIAILVVAIVLGLFYRQIAVRNLTEMGESKNVALTQAFANSLGPEIRSFLTGVSSLSGDELRAHPQVAELHRAALDRVKGLTVAKIKIYNLAGTTVFSTEAKQIGEDQSKNPGFLAARAGKVVTSIVHRDQFNAFDQIIENRDLLQTYLSIRGPTGTIEAVFELYDDVTPFLQKIKQTQRTVVVGVVLILSLLYGVLFLIVGHADRIIKRQDRERRQYIEEIKKANETLEQRVQERTQKLSALREIDLAITSTLDLRIVLDVLLEKIDRLLPFSASSVELCNAESGTLQPIATWNINEEEWHAYRSKGRGLIDLVFETKRIVTVENLQTDPRVKDPEFFRRHNLVSYVGVPLIAKGEVLGVLAFFMKEEHQFSNEEVEFLTTLAGQAAIAIHNSQLFEQTKKQAVELEKSNKVKDEFLSVMSHELRTPLNVVAGYTAIVKDKTLGDINPEQEKVLAKVLSRSSDLLTMINSILYATSLGAEAVKVERHEIKLASFLGELKADYNIPLDKELTLIWDYPSDLPVMTTDSAKLKHILQNLINNAVKFTKGGHVTISARYSPTTKAMKFQVADTGIGIPQEALPFIFDMFRQEDSSETRAYGGVGIGLYMVKKLTELIGGTVKVESAPGKGCIFTVTLPLTE